MRELTIDEKKIVEILLKYKKEDKIEELQSAKLLRNKLSCMAIIWSVESKYLKIYYNTDDDNFKTSFFEICDYLSFIEELEKNHLIKIFPLIEKNNKNQDNHERRLYDKTKFTYYKDKPNKLIPLQKDDDFFYANDKSFIACIYQAFQKIYIDIIDLLEKYGTGVIYPLPLLEDYVQHDFKTIEQRNFEKELDNANENNDKQIKQIKSNHKGQIRQMNLHHGEQIKKTNCSLKLASIAIIVSAVVPFLPKCGREQLSLNQEQINAIEKAIIESNPQKIEFYTRDTIFIKQQIINNDNKGNHYNGTR